MESTAALRRYAALAIGLAVCLPAWAAAQFTEPLRKGDLIRMLTAGAPSRPEIAGLIRKNCLAFRPTERDRTDLRAAGADAAILDAVTGCAAGGELRAVVPARAQGAAGSEAVVTVQLLRGTVPQPRVALVLQGSAALGGVPQDARAVTDVRGVATFRVTAGPRAGSYGLSVKVAAGTPLSGATDITFVVLPARRVRAEVQPREVVVRQGTAAGAQSGARVSVHVRDIHGNPVPGLPLELQGVTAQLGPGIAAASTDLDGQGWFQLGGMVQRSGEVGVYTRGVRLASFTVRLEVIALSGERTGFVGGANQHGVVRAALPQPLVFEARDAAGGPVVGQSVAFVATGGEVAPAMALTDSTGSVRVQVTLGETAGPVTVTATVGALERQATVFADPSRPRELFVDRGGVPVKGRLLLQSRDSVALHVAARDAYGNETPSWTVEAAVVGTAIRLRGAVGTTVTLEPRRSGAAELVLRAAGLEARLPVEVALPRPTGRHRPWAIGVRGSWLQLDYDWAPRPNVTGESGFAGTLFLRRALGPVVSLAVGGGVGAATADTLNGSVTAILLESYGRFEVAPLERSSVTPVLSVGGGGYRLRSDRGGRAIYHTALFASTGAGFDVAVGANVTLEVRGEWQWLMDFHRGHVATLWPAGLGVRFAL